MRSPSVSVCCSNVAASFLFQAAEEGLGDGVVPAIALPAHTRFQMIRAAESNQEHIYKNRELAIADLADYIDTLYNRTRRHSHLGGLSPEQFEAAHKTRRQRLH
jgi:transposase InsO family protein